MLGLTRTPRVVFPTLAGHRGRQPWRRGLIPLGLALVLSGAGGASPSELFGAQGPAVGASAAALIEAAKSADWEAVRSLLADGADAAATAPDGATALHWASYWDDVGTAELLIRAGADVDDANDLGATPLWNASLNGSEGMVRSLLEARASPNLGLLSGETPVMTAARTGNPRVLELLLSAETNPNATATRGQTALMWAASQRHSDAVRVLLEHGADVHARSDTWTPGDGRAAPQRALQPEGRPPRRKHGVDVRGPGG